jgi:hypothetical protein
VWSRNRHSEGVWYSTLIVQCRITTCINYIGPESSFGDIELGPLKSPLSVKPGALVELSTYDWS